ncbi:MAG: hypothetical protein Q8P49_01780, partial [Candidatus Liptonbacteria bacterium]|nr:hypothetical protein [Candidatus Liptonbacteria bacterium]
MNRLNKLSAKLRGLYVRLGTGSKRPLKIAIILGIALFSAGFFIASYKTVPVGEKGVWGGPAVASAATPEDSFPKFGALGTDSVLLAGISENHIPGSGIFEENMVGAAVTDPGQPI